jgi:hypothetical protein
MKGMAFGLDIVEVHVHQMVNLTVSNPKFLGQPWRFLSSLRKLQ